jgi:hypothetical protein
VIGNFRDESSNSFLAGRVQPHRSPVKSFIYNRLIWPTTCECEDRVRYPSMAEVAQNAQHDFWRPPIQTSAPELVHSELVEACDRCGTEFIVGARFCHNCGATRPEPSRLQSTIGVFPLIRIGTLLGLSTGALIAFLVGIVCVLGAVSVGFIFSAKTTLDWQAVQLWRIEWLLGAIASFIAGCLLKSNR